MIDTAADEAAPNQSTEPDIAWPDLTKSCMASHPVRIRLNLLRRLRALGSCLFSFVVHLGIILALAIWMIVADSTSSQLRITVLPPNEESPEPPELLPPILTLSPEFGDMQALRVDVPTETLTVDA